MAKKAQQQAVTYDPQERQAALHLTSARQIFYGGAAGGGKSHAIRWDIIMFCIQVPGIDCFLFRRTLPELEANHIRQIKREIPNNIATYSESRKRLEFSNGSGINFCYCEREDDVTRHQGAEIHYLGVDEASHLTEYQLNYLRTRVRLGSFADKVPEKYKHLLPRITFASNPGGPGHSFLKKTFIEPIAPETIFYDPTTAVIGKPKTGMPTVFIPAKMTDNRYLPESYAGQFTALAPELARALRDGDWDAVVGQAIHNLTRERHQLRPFTPPRHWTRFMSLDWGTAKPFSVGWYCVSDGALLAGKDGYPERWLPAGAVIRYAELYGWNGKPDQGCRMPTQKLALRILDAEHKRGEVIDYRIGDSQMWAQSDGPSPQENLLTASNGLIVLRKSKKDRKVNYAEVLSRLAGNVRFGDDGIVEEDPMFFVTADCRHFWRTVPILTLDTIDPEKGPHTKLEDHVYDEVCYGLRSRPYSVTEEERYEKENYWEIKEAMKRNVDPYATR